MTPLPTHRLSRALASDSSRGAFSLVEMVLAIAIVGAAVLPLVALVALSSREGKEARDEGVAARIGREVTGIVEQADHAQLNQWASNASAGTLFYDAEGQLLGINPAFQAEAVHTALIVVPPADIDFGSGVSSSQRRFSVLVSHRPGSLGSDDLADTLAGQRPIGKVHRFPGLVTKLEK